MHRVLLPFEFAEPTTVAEAVELIDGDSARALAGGVDLVLKMRLRQIVPDSVVSLQKLPGLDYVRVESDPRREKPRAGAAADAAADAAAGALSATPVASGATLHIGALASLWQVER